MKENKIEKLILDLSTRWECSPQEAVDRLNSMNESEINKLIKDMVKKFQIGGFLEDRVAFGTTERPRKFNPTEINPISKREAMQKYAGFGYDRGQLKRIYNRAAEHLGKENAAKWMSAAWDQRTPGQTGYLVPAEGQLQWEKAPAMQTGPEMPITNSDPQYFNGPRNFKFENGGIMKCLQGGKTYTECKKCGGKTPVVKNQEPAGTMENTVLPRYAKIVEQGWDKPRYTFLSDVNGGDLSTVTPDNVEGYEGMWYATEEVANPWAQWANKLNEAAGLPLIKRAYSRPDFRLIANQTDGYDIFPIRESASIVFPDWDQEKATRELRAKHQAIRNKKK